VPTGTGPVLEQLPGCGKPDIRAAFDKREILIIDVQKIRPLSQPLLWMGHNGNEATNVK
jgi:hypothetical protein